MSKQNQSLTEVLAQNEALQAQLQEALDTLEAIRNDEVDALVVSTAKGEQVYTLRTAEQPYRILVEKMQEGALTLLRDGTILYCNARMAEIAGRPMEDIVGSSVGELFELADRAAVSALLARETARGEFRLLTPDGRVVPVRVSASRSVIDDITNICLVVTDLTEQKRTEQVMASEQFVRRLLENAPVGVAVVGRDLRFIMANAAYGAIADGAPVVGRTIAEVFPPEVARIVEPAVQQAFERGQTVQFRDCEAPVRGRSWWNVTEVPLRDAAGNVEAVLILTDEVTEETLAREALKAAKTAAESANAAKDQFLAVLSHELRTPLTPVLMMASALESDSEIPDGLRDEMGMIKRSIQLEVNLIDDLLDVNRIARGKLELRLQDLDAHAKLEAALDICRGDAQSRGIAMQADLRAKEAHVQADGSRLQQVVWNLLKNAIKFTPRGGRVELRTSNPRPGILRIEVADTGIGVEPEAVPRLFNAFEQGSPEMTRQFGGLGLGLAICRSIVEALGGSIHAESAGVGHGATFVVELPTIPTALPQTAPDGHRPTAAGRSLRILLVEDHTASAQVMSRLLQGAAHEVRTAETVQEAVEVAKAETVDLVICDLGLPDGTGYDVIRQLRPTHPGLRCIALSGFGRETDIARSRQAGFYEHLVKPVDFATLQTAIQRAVSPR